MVCSQELQRQGVTLREALCARPSSSQDPNCTSPQLHAQHLRWGISSYTSYSCKEAVTIIPTVQRSSSICYYPKSFPKWWKGWQGLAFRQPAQFSPHISPPPPFFLRYRHPSFASTGWDAALGHRKLKVKKEHNNILWHADTIYHIKWFMWAICTRGKLS